MVCSSSSSLIVFSPSIMIVDTLIASGNSSAGMFHITYVETHRHLPPGVKRIIVHGGGCWIGEVDEMTALKYPHTGEEMKWVRMEAKILSILGSHPRVVQSKGLTRDGLLLEFALNGNLYDYLTTHPEVSLERRLARCIQATEAVAYIHSKRVLHCDMRATTTSF